MVAGNIYLCITGAKRRYSTPALNEKVLRSRSEAGKLIFSSCWYFHSLVFLLVFTLEVFLYSPLSFGPGKWSTLFAKSQITLQ